MPTGTVRRAAATVFLLAAGSATLNAQPAWRPEGNVEFVVGAGAGGDADPHGNVYFTRRRLNQTFLEALLEEFHKNGPKILERVGVLSENHIRTYWWCSPDKIGMATMTPDRWTARPRGASLPNAKCVRA